MGRAFAGRITRELFSFPVSIDEAKQLRLKKYIDEYGCLECQARLELSGKGPKARYVLDGVCVGCSLTKLTQTWSAWLQGDPGRPDPFHIKRQEAVDGGESYYWDGPCPYGDHFRYVSITSGACRTCHEHRLRQRDQRGTPRSKARKEGQPTYIPEEPCKGCKCRAIRRTKDGKCLACLRDRKGLMPVYSEETLRTKLIVHVRSASGRLMRDCPDLVLKPAEAREMGFTVYRTGEPCAYDHTGWRWVEGGRCVQCAKIARRR